MSEHNAENDTRLTPEQDAVCGCGHPAAVHNESGCAEWRRYPEVLSARPCACLGIWKLHA